MCQILTKFFAKRGKYSCMGTKDEICNLKHALVFPYRILEVEFQFFLSYPKGCWKSDRKSVWKEQLLLIKPEVWSRGVLYNKKNFRSKKKTISYWIKSSCAHTSYCAVYNNNAIGVKWLRPCPRMSRSFQLPFLPIVDGMNHDYFLSVRTYW